MAVSRTESICKEIHDSVGEEREKVVTRLLLGLTQSESRKMRQNYLKIYGDDLIEVVQKLDPRVSTLSGSMMLDPFERDAGFAREAIYRNGTADYKALMEIFATRKSSHFLLIREAYAAKYRSQLELDIAAIEPRHSYQKILMALSASHKAHHADISQHIAKCDAKRLYQTGEAKAGAIDEAVVLEIFTKRSISQLNLAFFSYNHIYGHSYTKFLKNRGVGEFEDAVRVVADCIFSPPRYYAKVLYACLKATACDMSAIERIMVSRAEVDMDEIQRSFKRKYQNELRNVICECVSEGEYRDFLVAMVTKGLHLKSFGSRSE